MRRVLWSLVLATLTLAVSGALLLGAIWQGAVQPPVGMVWLGPVALSAHRDCIAQWNMPCAAAKPWTLRLVVRRANGGWRLIRLLRVEPAQRYPRQSSSIADRFAAAGTPREPAV
jgi:hypothetical protein